MAELNVSSFDGLEEARAHYLKQVDSIAETARLQHITPGAGQSATYEAKHKEATAYPGGGPFPFLEAEAEALGQTPGEVADTIIAKRSEWEQIGSLIEAERISAKTTIRESRSPQEMYQSLQRFKEKLPV